MKILVMPRYFGILKLRTRGLARFLGGLYLPGRLRFWCLRVIEFGILPISRHPSGVLSIIPLLMRPSKKFLPASFSLVSGANLTLVIPCFFAQRRAEITNAIAGVRFWVFFGMDRLKKSILPTSGMGLIQLTVEYKCGGLRTLSRLISSSPINSLPRYISKLSSFQYLPNPISFRDFSDSSFLRTYFDFAPRCINKITTLPLFNFTTGGTHNA